MKPPWSLERGARFHPKEPVRFSVWAPRCRSVALKLQLGDGWVQHEMEPQPGGVFSAAVDGVTPGTFYWLCLDGESDRPDPVSCWQPRGVHGPSAVVDLEGFEWTDESWRGIDPSEYIIYELHVGTFTQEGTFQAVIEKLPYLRDLGITALELMPVAQFPGERNWGYDGVYPYAPQHSYGGPRGLMQLVDAAHRHGLAVVLDVVYNHLGPEGNYLGDYGPYFTDRYRTPWGYAINFDGPDSDEVRRYFIENALYWITYYHLDALRLDAVHAIYDTSPLHIVAELAAAVHRQGEALGRKVAVFAESDANDPRLVRPPEAGGLGVDAVWNEDFHHSIHALLTGERLGYYSDFGRVSDVAKCLRERFVLNGTYSSYRRRRHGAPAADVAARHFVAFVQNHDQVGNRAGGERLSKLVGFEALKLAAGLLLLSPYLPLLFMGEEYGEENPFLYFVSHGDQGLIEAVRKGREAELRAFGWSAAVVDPASVEAFEASKLTWETDAGEKRRALGLWYRDLVALRRREPALGPGGEVEVECDADAGWLSLLRRRTNGARWWVAFNLRGSDIETPLPDAARRWRIRLDSDDPRYGGRGRTPRMCGSASEVGGSLALPAYAVAVYREEGE
ncbi:Malto-oligosyltrehalose trehalohydrolase [bacterium HR33]|nr:Malto-oligosyltrehalose trehalohydrolase [bacterium HR33]